MSPFLWVILQGFELGLLSIGEMGSSGFCFYALECAVIAGYMTGILVSGCRSIWVFFC